MWTTIVVLESCKDSVVDWRRRDTDLRPAGGGGKKKRTEKRATISRKLTLQRGHQRDNRHCWMVITHSHYAAAVA